MTGWVKLPRSTAEHAALQNATRRGLFDKLYLMAERQPARREWRGSTITLDVAQTVISVRAFAEENEVGYKEARLHLARLQRDRLIKMETVKGAVRGASQGAVGTLITICLNELFSASDEISGAGRGAMNGAVRGAIGAQEGRNEGAPVLGEGENRETPNHVEPESLPPPAEPAPLPDPSAALWALCKALLPVPNPGSVAGRWCGTYGEHNVYRAVLAFRDADARKKRADPVSWIADRLKRYAAESGTDDDALRDELNAIVERTRATIQ